MATTMLEGLNARRIVKALERIAMGSDGDEGGGGGGDIEPGDYQELVEIVQSGEAEEYFEIGDQISMVWKDADGDDHELIWDVVGFQPVEDEHGTTHRETMWLQCHCALPPVAFDELEAVYVPGTSLPAGTYYFDTDSNRGRNLTPYWFTFTTVKGIPAGYQLCIETTDGTPFTSAETSNWRINIYRDGAQSTPEESLTVTQTYKSSGTPEGTHIFTITSANVPFAYNGVNHQDRIFGGYNRWSMSAIRQWLNSGDETGEWWTPKNPYDRRPAQLDDMDGFVRGLPADFASIIKPVKVVTALNDVSDASIGDSETTYDRFFCAALEQEYVNPETDVEGDALPYWIDRLGTQQSRSISDKRSEHTRYAIEDTSTARGVYLRSPYSLSSSQTWYVNPTGYVYQVSWQTQNNPPVYSSSPICVIY